MTEQRHLIRRQILELSISEEGAAWALQNELARLHMQHLQGALARVCDEVSDPRRVHRIDSLEIDLGRLSPENFERELTQRFPGLVRAALERKVRQLETELALRGEDPELTACAELISVFAASGVLPWWADPSQTNLVGQSLAALLHRGPELAVALLRALADEPGQLLRVIRGVPGEQRFELLRALWRPTEAAASEELRKLRSLLGAHAALPQLAAESFQDHVWTGMLAAACGEGGPSHEGQAFWRAVLAFAARSAQVPLHTLLNGLERSLPTALPGEPDDLRALLVHWDHRADHVDHERGDTAQRARARRDERAALRTAQALHDPTEIDLSNAGMVLIWPFLRSLFKRLGLMLDQKFRDSPCQHRAVGLLTHLATGELVPGEYQVPLAKVLCGLPLTEAFDFGQEVSAREADECSNLLQAAIAHAPMLGELSISGFRGSFLLRKGVLSQRDGAWLLRVERASYDVLLDRLPWSASLVKLPWMEAPLVAEWARPSEDPSEPQVFTP